MRVTPYMGVCIETMIAQNLTIRGFASHPIWVCVLKLIISQCLKVRSKVTPYMGVCIETSLLNKLYNRLQWSHPIWVCVLKQG